jgi:hypothetical protein
MRLIEMMAQLYTSYERWMELSVQRVEVQCLEERFQIEVRGKWRATGVNGDADAQQAAEMADRYNRLFLRTLRQLRDLRRYSVPIMINNPEQVNIAADGGQQVNVQKKERSKRRRASAGTSLRKRSNRTARTKPKQLGAKPQEVSIRTKPGSEFIQDDGTVRRGAAPTDRRSMPRQGRA